MDYINQSYLQLVSKVKGAKIKLNTYSDEFVELLNKKLGAKFIKLHKTSEKNGYICCFDKRLKRVTVALTNKYIDKLLAKTHANFIRILNEKSWGIESTFLKAIKFTNFAEEYYLTFKRTGKPIVTRKVWTNYMNGHSFAPSRYIISFYDIYWKNLLTANELRRVFSTIKDELKFNDFCIQQSEYWAKDSLPHIENLNSYLKKKNPYKISIDNFGTVQQVLLFPAVMDLIKIADEIKRKCRLTEFQKNIIAFKGSQIFRWVCTFTCEVITDNTSPNIVIEGDVKKVTDDLIERTRDILERHTNNFYETVVAEVQKIKLPEDVLIWDKRVSYLSECGQDSYNKMGKEICLSIEEWINELYEIRELSNK
ncbi:hypothetical protein [Spiroplasma endosymbiont of Aspidapion aeneum]|uniref:hypothetical protein n=1 Tax=Spiroplasma endosymbiont of Aspidapion aeneum TaxID=3066276 RepID=UPI00313AF491